MALPPSPSAINKRQSSVYCTTLGDDVSVSNCCRRSTDGRRLLMTLCPAFCTARGGRLSRDPSASAETGCDLTYRKSFREGGADGDDGGQLKTKTQRRATATTSRLHSTTQSALETRRQEPSVPHRRRKSVFSVRSRTNTAGC